MKYSALSSLYYFIIPFLIIGLSLEITSPTLAFLAMFPLFFTTTRHTVGIFLLMYGGSLGGIIRDIYPILPIYGILLEFLGIVLLWDMVKDLFQHNLKALYGILFTLAFFSFFYLIGPRDGAATIKIIKISVHGLMMLFGYYAYERSRHIDAEGLTRLLLVAAICFFSYIVSVVHMNPGGFLDFDWFRTQQTYYFYENGEWALVGYQDVGMLVLFGIAVFLSQVQLPKLPTLFYFVCCAYLALSSGCRQAILGVAIIVAFRIFVFRLDTQRTNNIIKPFKFVGIIGGLAIVLFIAFYFLQNIQSEIISNTLSSGDDTRELFLLQAFSIFMNNPLAGAGIGGFHAITGEVYPHNFFAELLCETGILGLLFTMVVMISALVRQKKGLRYISASNQFYFLIVMGIFIRVLVSSDLTESIELYSAAFAIASTNKHLSHSCTNERLVINSLK